ncbi:MAG: WcbI family polysaccharide biosynthesis putative acetyltransferase [Desulfomicrobium sp.]|nr:WcbI family polysaccharide biosynthesis putative acetyltransferase [Desulfomicrobium sp.]
MKKIAIIGNCQSLPLAELLRALCPDIKFVALTAVHRIEAGEVQKFLSILHTFDAVITQSIKAGYRDKIGVDTDNLRHNMVPQQKLVLIPNLYFEGLFPTWGYMNYKNTKLRGKMPPDLLPKAALQGVFATLRKMDYNCFFLLCAWFNSMTIDQTIAVLETPFDLDAVRVWSDNSLAEFAQREKTLHTQMLSLVQEIVKKPDTKYWFHSFNHPNKALLEMLAVQVLEVLNIKKRPHACVDTIPDRLGNIFLPVYPLVMSSLSVERIGMERLKIYDASFSISEFVQHYFTYFDCLGKAGLSVNCANKKYILCEKLLFKTGNLC